MSNLSDLGATLRGYGYDVRIANSTDGAFAAMITGGELHTVQAVVRASKELLNAGAVIGVLETAPSTSRHSLLLDALELNFAHPLARISMFRIPPPADQDTEANMGVFLAETSFFHTEITKLKFDARMNALNVIGYAFSKILSSKDALLGASPWQAAIEEGLVSKRKFDRPW